MTVSALTRGPARVCVPCRYALGVVLLELLTAQKGLDVVELVSNEEEFFADITQGQHLDPKCQDWPPPALAVLVGVAERCMKWHVKRRATVKEVLEELKTTREIHVR